MPRPIAPRRRARVDVARGDPTNLEDQLAGTACRTRCTSPSPAAGSVAKEPGSAVVADPAPAQVVRGQIQRPPRRPRRRTPIPPVRTSTSKTMSNMVIMHLIYPTSTGSNVGTRTETNVRDPRRRVLLRRAGLGAAQDAGSGLIRAAQKGSGCRRVPHPEGGLGALDGDTEGRSCGPSTPRRLR